MRGRIYNPTPKPVKWFLEDRIDPVDTAGLSTAPKGHRVLPWQSLGKEYPAWLALRPVIVSARTECFASLPISQTGATDRTTGQRAAPTRSRTSGTRSLGRRFLGYRQGAVGLTVLQAMPASVAAIAAEAAAAADEVAAVAAEVAAAVAWVTA